MDPKTGSWFKKVLGKFISYNVFVSMQIGACLIADQAPRRPHVTHS